MFDWSAYFTVAEAAVELSTSQARVRKLIEANVLAAEKVAGRWLISPESVHARKRTQRRRGRPLRPEVIWSLIDSGFIGRLLVRSDEVARHNVRIQLAHRALVNDVFVLPALIARLEPLIAPGGRVLAEDAGVPAGRNLRWELDAYAHAGDVDVLRRKKIISSVKGQPNVRLRVVDHVERKWLYSRSGRLLVAWLDLADDGDRAADITLNALVAELKRTGVEPFPVGNEVVARVSLATLAALQQEMAGGT